MSRLSSFIIGGCVALLGVHGALFASSGKDDPLCITSPLSLHASSSGAPSQADKETLLARLGEDKPLTGFASDLVYTPGHEIDTLRLGLMNHLTKQGSRTGFVSLGLHVVTVNALTKDALYVQDSPFLKAMVACQDLTHFTLYGDFDEGDYSMRALHGLMHLTQLTHFHFAFSARAPRGKVVIDQNVITFFKKLAKLTCLHLDASWAIAHECRGDFILFLSKSKTIKQISGSAPSALGDAKTFKQGVLESTSITHIALENPTLFAGADYIKELQDHVARNAS